MIAKYDITYFNPKKNYKLVVLLIQLMDREQPIQHNSRQPRAHRVFSLNTNFPFNLLLL